MERIVIKRMWVYRRAYDDDPVPNPAAVKRRMWPTVVVRAKQR
jgi:hypothetical protein